MYKITIPFGLKMWPFRKKKNFVVLSVLHEVLFRFPVNIFCKTKFQVVSILFTIQISWSRGNAIILVWEIFLDIDFNFLFAVNGDCPRGQKTDDFDGRCCVFPFMYKGIIYYSCTSVDHDRLWCSLDAFSNQWANCGKEWTTTVKRLQSWLSSIIPSSERIPSALTKG